MRGWRESVIHATNCQGKVLTTEIDWRINVDFWTTTFWTVVTEGVAISLMLAGLAWIWRKCHERREHRGQIEYIATFLERERQALIITIDRVRIPGTPLPEDPGDSRIREKLRWSRHKLFRMDLHSVLFQRCTQLTYDETAQVRDLFLRHYEMFPDSANKEDLVRSFRKAESIKWLGLKPMNSD